MTIESGEDMQHNMKRGCLTSYGIRNRENIIFVRSFLPENSIILMTFGKILMTITKLEDEV